MSNLPQECYQNNLFYFYYKGERHNLITSKIIGTKSRHIYRHIYFYLECQNIVVDFTFQEEFKGFPRENIEKGGYIKFDANKLFNPLSPISFLSYLKDYQKYVFEITKKLVDKSELNQMLKEYEETLNYDGSIRHNSCKYFFVSYKEMYKISSSSI